MATVAPRKPQITNRPRAFSYLRFSTPDQMKGDSYRRQTEAAMRYAEQHGLELDEGLTFHDLGVSAFRGRNLVEGALGQFVAAVDAGRVPRGSYLIVENVDRLSRERIMSALALIQSLLERGISVITLSDGKVYTADSLNNLGDLMIFLVHASRAHEESEMKSKRIKAAWVGKRQKAQQGAIPLTAKAPAWLRLDHATRTFTVIKDRAELIRRIFAMALEGYGKATIATRLNSEGLGPFGDGANGARRANGWHASYLQKILDNEAVIGRFQPMKLVIEPKTGRKRREADGEPIENYFPAIIDPDVFHRVRFMRRERRTVSGPKGETFSNILSGLVTCGQCGAPMHYRDKGKPPKGGIYLACSDAYRHVGTCRAPAVRYDVVLFALLNSFIARDLDLRALLGVGAADTENARRQKLLAEIEALEGRERAAYEAQQNYLKALEKAGSASLQTTLLTRLEELEGRLAESARKKATLQDELRELTYATASRENVFGDVEQLVRAWNEQSDAAETNPALRYDLNVRLNAALKRLMEGVAVGVADTAREWIEGQLLPHVPGALRVGTDFVRETMHGLKRGVSFTVRFRGAEDRHLIVFADGRTANRFVSAGFRVSEGRPRNVTITVK